MKNIRTRTDIKYEKNGYIIPFESIEKYFLCPYRYYIEKFDVWINSTIKTQFIFDIESGLRNTLQKPLLAVIEKTVEKDHFTAGTVLDMWSSLWEKQKGLTIIPNSSNFDIIKATALSTIIKVMQESAKIEGDVLPVTDAIYYTIQETPYKLSIQFKPDLLIYKQYPQWKRNQAYFVYVRKEILPQDSYFAHYYLPFLFYTYLVRDYLVKITGNSKYKIGVMWIDAGLGSVWSTESIGNLYKGFTNKYMNRSIKTIAYNIKNQEFYRKTSIFCSSCLVRHRCINKICFNR